MSKLSDSLKIGLLTDYRMINSVQDITTLFASSLGVDGIQMSDVLNPDYSPCPVQFFLVGDFEETKGLSLSNSSDREKIWLITGRKMAELDSDIIIGRHNDFSIRILFHLMLSSNRHPRYIRFSGAFGQPFFERESYMQEMTVAQIYTLDLAKKTETLRKLLTDKRFYQVVADGTQDADVEALVARYSRDELRLPLFEDSPRAVERMEEEYRALQARNPHIVTEGNLRHAIDFITRKRGPDEIVSALDYHDLMMWVVRAYCYLEVQSYTKDTLAKLEALFDGSNQRLDHELERMRKGKGE